MKKTLLVMVSLMVGACATTPPAELVEAREKYQEAAQGPARTLAPSELYQAQKMVNAADRAYEDTGDSLETRDWAYLAIRKTEIAESRARSAQQLACMARDKRLLLPPNCCPNSARHTMRSVSCIISRRRSMTSPSRRPPTKVSASSAMSLA